MPDHKRITNDLENPSIQERLSGEYTVHGLTVNVEVSPCSWMYENYGLQVMYGSHETHSWGFCNRKNLPAGDATREDVQAMLDEQTELHQCEECGQDHLKDINPDHPGNREEKCETCFMANHKASFAKLMEEENKKQAKKDAKMKQKGFTHKSEAWVHPPRGGDDYQVLIYWPKEPTPEEVREELAKTKGVAQNTHVLTPL